MTQPGYAGSILMVDLSSGRAHRIPTSDYNDRFCGGRGIAAKLYWDLADPASNVLDPSNPMIFVTGPLSGVPAVAGSRWQVIGKSPYTTPCHYNYSNLGGRWGAFFKFAGYDALVVQGRAEKPACLVVSEDGISIKDATPLWGKRAIETRETLKADLGQAASVAAIGPAGENLAVMASILADQDAVATAGMGSVMGAKNLKAIAVIGKGRRPAVAQPDRMQELIRYFLSLDRIPLKASGIRYSEDVPNFSRVKMKKPDPCYGCRGCLRRTYEAENGLKGKFFCASALFYQPWVVRYHGGWKDDVAFYATKLVDDYGMDTKVIDRTIGWLHACYQAGILTDENTGIPISRVGSLEFIETLARRMARREGFGDILAEGYHAAALSLGTDAVKQAEEVGYLGRPDYELIYDPRLYIPHALFYAMEPRLPMFQFHEYGKTMRKYADWANEVPGAGVSPDVVRGIARRFWGSEIAADMSTYEGKALAAKKIQDRVLGMECLIVCDMMWPVQDRASTADHIGDSSLPSKLLSAVTGKDVDEDGLDRIGERVFNLQRAILLREGRCGREADEPPERCFKRALRFDQVNPGCVVPGRDWEPISRKGATLDRDSFERMKTEYYELRGWSVETGLQTRTLLERLELKEVADDLEVRRLLG